METSTTKNLEIVKLLGKGAFGSVYLAHPVNDKKTLYAVKVIEKVALTTSSRKARACRENVIPRYLNCNHPNILCVRDYNINNKYVYIVSDYIADAKNLDQYTLPSFRTGVGIAYQLADGYTYMHNKNIAHRDIKPGNVVMDGNKPVIIDFDLACFQGINVGDRINCSGRAGTPTYMAPEVLLSEYAEGVDWFAADVYSLGGVLFSLFTNHNRAYTVPPKPLSPKKTPRKVHFAAGIAAKESPKKPSELEKKVAKDEPDKLNTPDPLLNLLVTEMMSRNPKDRPSMARVSNVLKMMLA